MSGGVDVTMGNDVTMASGATSGASQGRIDQYELVRELGGGGFGCVYLARDTVAGVEVAVKGLPPEVRHNKEELENIRANFALVSRLHHPNIAAALVLHPVTKAEYANRDAMEKLRVFEGDTLMVMEYAPGVTLSQWRKQFPERRVPHGRAMEIVSQVASALDYAHERRIVHRDIKPANIMVETDRDGGVVARVLDFGLAAEIRSSLGRVSREVKDTSGTRPYMAPEQWSGRRQGAATDQYALAVLYCELVSGEVPFASVFDTGDPLVMMNVVCKEEVELPPDFDDVQRSALTRALAKTPDERFGSCMDLVAALNGEKVSRAGSRSKPTASAVRRKGGRGFGAAVMIGGTLLVAAVIAGAVYYKGKIDEAKRLAELRKNVALSQIKAKQACDGLKKAEYHELPGFVDQIRLAEVLLLQGANAVRHEDYAAATKCFADIKGIWYSLESNAVVRTRMLPLLDEVKALKAQADKVTEAAYATPEYQSLGRRYDDAVKCFNSLDFNGAGAIFASLRESYPAHVAATLAAKEKREKEAIEALRRELKGMLDEKNPAALDVATRLVGKTKASADKSLWVEAWLQVNSAKGSPFERKKLTEEERQGLSNGWFWQYEYPTLCSFDLSDGDVLHALGQYYEFRAEDDRKDIEIAREFYRRSSARGCKGARSRLASVERKLQIKPYFDAVKSGELEKIKQLVTPDNPRKDIVDGSGTTLMHTAALTDPQVLDYMCSVGYSPHELNPSNGITPIFSACANTNSVRAIAAIKWFTDHGCDLNARNMSTNVFAAPYPIFSVNDAKVFSYLVAAGARTDVVDRQGKSLLHCYAGRGEADLVGAVVELCDVNAFDNTGCTPLYYAAGSSSRHPGKVIETLLRAGARVDERMRKGYHVGYTALHHACCISQTGTNGWKSAEIVKALLRGGANVESVTAGGTWEGHTPLLCAAHEGNLSAVKTLLEAKADANAVIANGHSKGRTVLHVAVEEPMNNALEIVEVLLKHGAEVDAPIKGGEYYIGQTPLCRVVQSGHKNSKYAIAEALIRHGADAGRQSEKSKYRLGTPLEFACKEEDCKMVALLLGNGGEKMLGARTEDGQTILHLLADETFKKQEEIMGMLIKKGAVVDARIPDGTYAGYTPLFFAVRDGNISAVRALVDGGADVNARDKDLATPLHTISWLGEDKVAEATECVRYLVSHGAEVGCRDKWGKAPVDRVKVEAIRKLFY